MLNGTGRTLTKNSSGDPKDTEQFEGKQPYRKELDFVFHSESTSTNSARFIVTGKPILFSATGLQDDEVVHVMRFTGDGSSAYAPIPGKFLRISSSFSNIMLGEPGTYQLVLSDNDMVGRVIISKKFGADNNFFEWLKAIGPFI